MSFLMTKGKVGLNVFFSINQSVSHHEFLTKTTAAPSHDLKRAGVKKVSALVHVYTLIVYLRG
jgi:hypothetical protein